MGLRFRKSIRIGKHFRINLSTKGVGYSFGGKGFRYTRSANGKHYNTYSIPGTGVSYRQSLDSNTRQNSAKRAAPINQQFSKSESIARIIIYGIFFAFFAFMFFSFVFKEKFIVLAIIFAIFGLIFASGIVSMIIQMIKTNKNSSRSFSKNELPVSQQDVPIQRSFTCSERVLELLFNYVPPHYTEQTVKTAVQIYEYNAVRIIKDCEESLKTTNDIETFFSRRKLLYDTLDNCAEIENDAPFFTQIQPSTYRIELTNHKADSIDDFIARSYAAELENANQLKAENGRNDRIERYFQSLKQYENEMLPQNLDYIRSLDNYDFLMMGFGNLSVTDTQDESTIYPDEKKLISDAEVPSIIESSYQKSVEIENAYKDGSRNIFSDNSFSAEENIFFQNVYSEFGKAKLKPNLIKVTRLSNSTFNVDYIGVCYLGKVRIKDGMNYYIQYSVGSNPNVNDVNADSLNELIGLIPRWVRYVNYCKRQ